MAESSGGRGLMTLVLGLGLGGLAGAGAGFGVAQQQLGQFRAGAEAGEAHGLADAVDADNALAAFIIDAARERALDTSAPMAERRFALSQLALLDADASYDAVSAIYANEDETPAMRLAALSTFRAPADGARADAFAGQVLDDLAGRSAPLSAETLAQFRAFFAGLDAERLPAVRAWFDARPVDDAIENPAAAAIAMGDAAFINVLIDWATSEQSARSEAGWRRLADIDPQAAMSAATRRTALARLVGAVEPLIARGPEAGERMIGGIPNSYVQELFSAIQARDADAMSGLRSRAAEFDNDQLDTIYEFVFAAGAPDPYSMEQLSFEFATRSALDSFLGAGPSAPPDLYGPYRRALAGLMRADAQDWTDVVRPAIMAAAEGSADADQRRASALVGAAWASRLAESDSIDDVLMSETLAAATAAPEAFAQPAAAQAFRDLLEDREDFVFANAPALFAISSAAGDEDAFATLLDNAVGRAMAEVSADEDGAAEPFAALREAAARADLDPTMRAGLGRAIAAAAAPDFATARFEYLYGPPQLDDAIDAIAEAARSDDAEAVRVAALDVLSALVIGADEADAGYRTAIERANLHRLQARPIALGDDAAAAPSDRELARIDALRAAGEAAAPWLANYRELARPLALGASAPLADFAADGAYWIMLEGQPDAAAELRLSAAADAYLFVDAEGRVADGGLISRNARGGEVSVAAPGEAVGETLYARISLSDPSAAAGVEARAASIRVLDLSGARTSTSAVDIEPGARYALDTEASGVEDGWMRLIAPAPGVYVISTYDLGERTDTTLEAFRADGRQSIMYNDDYDGLASRVSVNATQPGETFLIELGHFGSSLGPFRLSVEQRAPAVSLAPAQGEPTAIALTVGETYYLDSSNLPGGWVSFTAQDAGQYEVLTFDLEDVDTTLTSVEDGQDVDYNDDGGDGLASRLVINAQPGETRYVRIGHFAGDTTGGRFNLRVTALEPAFVLDEAGAPETAHALEVGVSQPIEASGGVSGWARFETPQAGRYMIATSELASGVDTTLALHRGEAREFVARNDDALGLESEIAFDAEAGEVFYAQIENIGWSAGRFRIEVSPHP